MPMENIIHIFTNCDNCGYRDKCNYHGVVVGCNNHVLYLKDIYEDNNMEENNDQESFPVRGKFVVDAVKDLSANTKKRLEEELEKKDYDYLNIDLTNEDVKIEINKEYAFVILGLRSEKGVYFALKSPRDFKVLLFDLGYYLMNANNVAMNTIVTESEIIIKEYYFDENKEYIVLEFSSSIMSKMSKGARYFMKSEALLNAIKNLYTDDLFNSIYYFQYSRFMDYNTDDFMKFED